jgi:hypothetical protein
MTRGARRKWADLVEVRGRYQRSVNLEKDAFQPGSLQGYVVTPLVRSLVGRVVNGYVAGQRAWSVTGPYGAGKSAFAVFLSELLGGPVFAAQEDALALLRRSDPAMAVSLWASDAAPPLGRGLCPVIATGERRSADAVLLRALDAGLARFWSRPGAKPPLLREVGGALKKAEKGLRVPARDVVALFESAAEKVATSSNDGGGLLVVVDELGKLLEFAAQEPSAADVQVLQELAESANRSAATPIVLVTLLHQAFDQYASRLSATQRKEWGKMQGRFEDLPFLEEPHELFYLIGEAFEHKKGFSAAAASVEHAVTAVVDATASQDGATLKDRLRQALPLHPATALVLGPLFRSGIAQNQRSLFALLCSGEPHGFKAFLKRESAPALYEPDELYDYVAAALGDRMYGHSGKQWALIWSALQRLPEDAEQIDARVVKCVVILSIFGDAVGLRAGQGLLRAIYGEGAVAALGRLKSASIVVYRKFRGAWFLWEGSDIDLDARFRDALAEVRDASSLAKWMSRLSPPRPAVARRHLLETGTLRYFEFRFVDLDDVATSVPVPSDDADGAVLLVLEPEGERRAALVAALRQPLLWQDAKDAGKPVVVGVPPQATALLETGLELAALERVQERSPDLRDDAVAQRELSSRLAECEKKLRAELRRIVSGEVEVPWFVGGDRVRADGARGFAALLSELCENAYHKAPRIRNELVNRRTVSSSAAAVRQALLCAMAESADRPRLGFEKSPPELSIYRSVLEVHGLHREQGERWGFTEPYDLAGSLLPVWREIRSVLQERDEQRVSVADVYARLKRPPFGMKDGVLPIVLTAALLAWRDETALYEDGAFVSSVNSALLERLVRHPGRFEVQEFDVSGARTLLFERLAGIMLVGHAPPARLLPIVRRLIRVVRELPDHARQTKSVSPRAQAVREALLRAKEPAPLVFSELPAACGFPPFTAKADHEAVDGFVRELRESLDELKQAYPRLLDELEASLGRAFKIPSPTADLRRELVERGSGVAAHATDPKLRAFLGRIGYDTLDREGWLTSLGTLFGGKPPDAWSDADHMGAKFAISQMARRFSSAEAMTVDGAGKPLSGDLQLIRVSVTEAGRGEIERVVPLRAAEAKQVAAMGAMLRRVVETEARHMSREALVAALGLAARELMSETDADQETSAESDA